MATEFHLCLSHFERQGKESKHISMFMNSKLYHKNEVTALCKSIRADCISPLVPNVIKSCITNQEKAIEAL